MDSKIFKDLDSTNTETRSEALNTLQGSLMDNDGHVMIGNLKRLFQLLKLRLKDDNWGVIEQAEEYIYDMIPEFGPELESYMSIVLPGLVENLGHSKALVRRGASRVLSRFLKFTQNSESLFSVLITYGIDSDQVDIRVQALNAIPKVVTAIQGTDYHPLLEAVIGRLNDVDESVIPPTQAALKHLKLVLHTSFDRVLESTSSFHQNLYKNNVVDQQSENSPQTTSVGYSTPTTPSSGRSKTNSSSSSLSSSSSSALNKKSASFDIQEGGSSSDTREAETTQSQGQRSNVQFGFVPNSVLQSLQNDGNWRIRASGIEELYNLIANLQDKEILAPHLSELLQFLTATTLDDPNFKISLTTFKIIHFLVEMFQADIWAHLNDFVPHLIEKLGDNKVIIRQANMQLFYSLMDHLTPNPIMGYLLGALSHDNAYVREDVVNIIIMSMLTFPDNAFDFEQLVESLDAALIDAKPKVKLVAIEAFAVIYDAVGDSIYDMAAFMSQDTLSVLSTRFELPFLPTVDPETGLVEHSFIKRSTTPSSRASSRASSRNSRRSSRSSQSQSQSRHRTSRNSSRSGSRAQRSGDGLRVSVDSSAEGPFSPSGSGKLPFQVSKPRSTSARRSSATSTSASYENLNDAYSGYGDFQLQQPTGSSNNDLEADIELASQDRKLGYDLKVTYEEDAPDSVFAGSVGFYQTTAAEANINVLSPSSDSGSNTIFDWQMSPGSRRSQESLFDSRDEPLRASKTPEMFEPPPSGSGSTNNYSQSSVSGEYDTTSFDSDDFDPFKPRSELSRDGEQNSRSTSRHRNRQMTNSTSIGSSGEYGYGSQLSKTPESKNLGTGMGKSDSADNVMYSPRLAASLVKHHDQRRASTSQQSVTRKSGSRNNSGSGSGGGSYAKRHGSDRRVQSASRRREQEEKAKRMQQRKQRQMSLAESAQPRYADLVDSSDDEDMDSVFAERGRQSQQSQRSQRSQVSQSQESEAQAPSSSVSTNNEDRPIQGLGAGSYLDAAIDQYGAEALSPIKERNSEGSVTNSPSLNSKGNRLSSATRNRLAKSAERKHKQRSYASQTQSRENPNPLDRLNDSGSGSTSGSNVGSSVESLDSGESYDSHDSYGSANRSGSGSGNRNSTSRSKPRVGSGGKRVVRKSQSSNSMGEDTPQRSRRATLMESNAKPLGELTSEELEPLESPSKMVKAALADLASKEAKWDSQFESLNTLRRAAAFHGDLLINGDFHATILLINEAVNNLRSSITKNAIMLYTDIFTNMGKSMDSQLDYVVPVLVKKTGETNVFITDAVDQALESMVNNATESKVLASLMVVGGHKSPAVRGNAAFYMDRLLSKMGNRVLSVKGFDRLLKLISGFSKEGNSVTRNIGKHMAYQVFKACGSDSAFEKKVNRANLDEKTVNQLHDAVKAAVAAGGDNMPVNKLSAGQRRKYSTIGLSNRTMNSAGGTRHSPQSPMTGPMYKSSGGDLSSTSSTTSTTSSSSSASSNSGKSVTNGRRSNMKSRETSAGRRGKRSSRSTRSAGTSRGGSMFQSVKMPVEFDKVNTIASDMDDKNWQKRMDGMEAMVDLIKKYPEESVSVLPKLFDGFSPRLSDANLKVLIQALTHLPDILSALGDNVEVVLTSIVLAMPSSLSSSKKRVQDLASNAMSSMVQNVSASLLAEPFSSLVNNGNSRLRPVMLDIMMELIDPLYQDRPDFIGKYVLPMSFGLLSENKIDLKKRNYALIRKCNEVLGKTDFEVYVGGLSMEDEETVRRIL